MTERRPVDWVLRRSVSAFNDVVRARRERGDGPRDPAEVLLVGRDRFGLLEWADGRWLVLRLQPRPPARRRA